MATILISGASGFIGSHLVAALRADGHRIARLRRARTGQLAGVAETVRWDPESGDIDADGLARIRPDVVINLAGEPIARRWTAQRRQRIYESRVRGTAALAGAIAATPVRPEVFISGSAIGYYGADRGSELLDENSAPGSDFLAATAQAWEQATAAASHAGIRVVTPRTGVVLGPEGGALKKMLLPFRLGLGGRLGDGTQWMSWISLWDTVSALRFLMTASALSGAVNLVAPNPVQNSEFTRVLAQVLRRPAILPVPRLAMRIAFGEMADATVLASQRVRSARLEGGGFAFTHLALRDALSFELSRTRASR